MGANFQFQISVNGGTSSKKGKHALSPQDEYWLDRILRNHAGQLFWLVFMFMILLFGTIFYAVRYGGNTSSTNTGYTFHIEGRNK